MNWAKLLLGGPSEVQRLGVVQITLDQLSFPQNSCVLLVQAHAAGLWCLGATLHSSFMKTKQFLLKLVGLFYFCSRYLLLLMQVSFTFLWCLGAMLQSSFMKVWSISLVSLVSDQLVGLWWLLPRRNNSLQFFVIILVQFSSVYQKDLASMVFFPGGCSSRTSS